MKILIRSNIEDLNIINSYFDIKEIENDCELTGKCIVIIKDNSSKKIIRFSKKTKYGYTVDIKSVEEK